MGCWVPARRVASRHGVVDGWEPAGNVGTVVVGTGATRCVRSVVITSVRRVIWRERAWMAGKIVSQVVQVEGKGG